MNKFSLIIAMLLYFTSDLSCQKNYTTDELSNMVVGIADQTSKRTRVLGTATLLKDSSKYYLLTATHITDSIIGDCYLIFRGNNDKLVMLSLEIFTGKKN